MKVCNFLGNLFIFILFSFVSIFNLSASCVKVEDSSFAFLPQDGEECINKSENGVLPIPNGGVNNFDVLIPGKNDGGYTIELVFDRDNQAELSGEQSLFAFYSSEDAINPVSELVLKGSSIFYKVNNTNTEDQEGVDLSGSAFNDANITNPHAIIIVHDNVDNQVIFNIDGAELKIPDVPSVNATDIKRVKIGKNYVGNISEFRVYGTELALKERAGAVKLLSGITGAKIAAIELVKDENGVTRSAVDSSDLVKCKTGQTVINGKCNNAMISGFTPPSNSIYNGGSDIQYDPAHNGQENAKLLDCDIGYEAGSTPPKYWFTLDGYVPSVRTEGSCVEKTYILGQDGNDALPANAIDPGTLTASNLANYTSINPKPLECISGHAKSSDFGVYVDNEDILRAQGSCTYNSLNSPLNSPDCYDPSINPVKSIATSDGCAGMLVVDRAMLNAAKADGSFDFKPSDTYTSHNNGITYSFSNGANNIFTGQVTNMRDMFRDNAIFNADISHWDVSSVTDMNSMFYNNSIFNGDISNWDVSSVTTMSGMFRGNSAFNGDISNWDVSSVTGMGAMFKGNSAFNGDISNWDVSSVTSMKYMFIGDSAFNGDISNWNTSNVTTMSYMFQDSTFNGNISNWNTSNVTNMSYMFYRSVFNGDISNWCVQSVTNYVNFDNNSTLPNEYKPPFGTSNNCN